RDLPIVGGGPRDHLSCNELVTVELPYAVAVVRTVAPQNIAVSVGKEVAGPHDLPVVGNRPGDHFSRCDSKAVHLPDAITVIPAVAPQNVAHAVAVEVVLRRRHGLAGSGVGAGGVDNRLYRARSEDRGSLIGGESEALADERVIAGAADDMQTGS